MPACAGMTDQSNQAYRKPMKIAGDEKNLPLKGDTAGVHWRSDGIEGLKLGEAVTIGILTDLRTTCPEPFAGFSFTKFDGTTITI